MVKRFRTCRVCGLSDHMDICPCQRNISSEKGQRMNLAELQKEASPECPTCEGCGEVADTEET